MQNKKEITLNPLGKYKEITGSTYDELSDQTGLPRQTLCDIANMSPLRMGQIRLRTVHIINKKLGIDLLKYFQELDKINQ